MLPDRISWQQHHWVLLRRWRWPGRVTRVIGRTLRSGGSCPPASAKSLQGGLGRTARSFQIDGHGRCPKCPSRGHLPPSWSRKNCHHTWWAGQPPRSTLRGAWPRWAVLRWQSGRNPHPQCFLRLCRADHRNRTVGRSQPWFPCGGRRVAGRDRILACWGRWCRSWWVRCWVALLLPSGSSRDAQPPSVPSLGHTRPMPAAPCDGWVLLACQWSWYQGFLPKCAPLRYRPRYWR